MNAQLQDTLREVEEAVRSQDLTRALSLSDEAVGKGFEHPRLFVFAAHHRLKAGAADRALEIARRAQEAAPRSIDVLNVLGLSLARLNRGREALPIFDAALSQSPRAVDVRFNKALTLEQLRETKCACAEYERVLDLQPTHVESLVHMAHLAMLRRDLKAAREFARRALEQNSGLNGVQFVLARADIEDKNFGEAITRLEALTKGANVNPITRSIALGLIGDSLDGLGRPADAFDAWSKSRATLRAYHEPTFKAGGAESARGCADRLTTFFARRSGQSWRDAADPYEGPVHKHVFLVSFPRSGTTLLNQVLASHPDVESMEERDCLVDAIESFVEPQDGPDKLAALPQSALAQYRDSYWRIASAEGAVLNKPVFIDKMPLDSVALCAIAKLFPNAKILFALRDPRDVVFSCFRRRFAMTPQMFELTSLQSAADYYDAVMRLCEIYRGTLDMEFCETRHEDLVGNFDAECRRLCAFIELEWDQSMRDFAERARAGIINTPSAPQVARGLFTEGMGQWRQYRDQLAPVLPKLAPWVSRFGYPAD
jgi:Flp pilus assembly protein TadD